MTNLDIEICGIKIRNPIMSAAGPIVRDAKSVKKIIEAGVGAVVTKTISVKAAKVPHPNMAVDGKLFFNSELWSEIPWQRWITQIFPSIKEMGVPLIISMGYTGEDISFLAPKIADLADAVELSTHYLGDDPKPMLGAIRAAKENLDIPVWVKVSPNVRDVGLMAKQAMEAGADAIVAINSLGPGLSIDINKKSSRLGGKSGYGWVSGPAIKPLALRYVYEISKNVDIPVIGVGGISKAEDVVEMMIAGASAVQICTAAILKGPKIFTKIIERLEKILDKYEYKNISEIIGLYSEKKASEKIPSYTAPPIIDFDICNLCERCVKSCVYNALSIVENKLKLDKNKCGICGLCATRCPINAINFN